MGPAMPLPLIVSREHDESDAAPPVRKLPSLPARLDAKADFPLIVFREQEPFDAALDVSFERVVPEPEHAGLVADPIHDGGAEIVQPEHLNLEEHAATKQRFCRIEMREDDAGIGELVVGERDSRAREAIVALLVDGDDRLGMVVMPAVLAGHVLFDRVEVDAGGRRRRVEP